MRKIKRGSGKYKGKLPFKCFNCGRVGHFSTKFPYTKGKIMMMRTIMRNKNIIIKSNIIDTKEENILIIRVSTVERTIARLKKVMDMF